MSVAAVVVAAGSGDRLGAGQPKAMVRLGGSTILDTALAVFLQHPRVAEVVVVAPPDLAESLARATGVRVVPGGSTRADSVQRGLSAVSEQAELVLVHDAARPLVPARVLSNVIDALLAGATAVVPVLPMIDTVKQVDEQARVTATVHRDRLRRVQTPQGFRLEVLRAAYAAAGVAASTDDAGVVELHGVTVLTVPGDEEAFKITTPHDLRIAELLVHGR
ncbi:MAG TPA: 2-C-methyl-D-erythritol 4-phosphate cytidylyltransferase [Jatrophihabitans sp.]|nr:2-C-methyl-D-erythritol 4-phosphate cytidylyltransferase [Jatrophihabitans sp.]